MFVIQLQDIPPLYWSAKKTVHPAGMWGEKKDAMHFTTKPEAEQYIEFRLKPQAEMCKVVSN